LTNFFVFAIILGLKRHIIRTMARKTRIEFPGIFYHVLARGNNKQVIFKDDQDYNVFIIRLKRYEKRYKFMLYAYTLMPNHTHLLIETGITPLSKIMQGIQQSYTYYYHKKYKSVGHLFQGRYKAILCQRDTYLLELVRYVHLNPVRAALVDNPDDYLWNSHQAYLGYLNQPFVKKDLIFKMFSEDESAARKKYWQFIRDGIDKRRQNALYNVIDQRYLGNPEFVERVKQKIKSQDQTENQKREQNIHDLQNLLLIKNKTLPEILKIVTEITGVYPESILGKSREQLISRARSLFVLVATRRVGISNKSLAEFLRRDASSISNMIRRIEAKINIDQVLANHLDKVIKVLKV
jgi:putative transposase